MADNGLTLFEYHVHVIMGCLPVAVVLKTSTPFMDITTIFGGSPFPPRSLSPSLAHCIGVTLTASLTPSLAQLKAEAHTLTHLAVSLTAMVLPLPQVVASHLGFECFIVGRLSHRRKMSQKCLKYRRTLRNVYCSYVQSLNEYWKPRRPPICIAKIPKEAKGVVEWRRCSYGGLAEVKEDWRTWSDIRRMNGV
ncbi:hypothetical protein TorRG33x02_268180 [Trema orientale]|uniref:Uncharacterized protein n=1 Tax=Trema orientale TaxID=63057 RepID=A0A2P5CZ93_TREOI|nr:hypothetical protein TorRG33x02_268180 [Trema orientale]